MFQPCGKPRRPVRHLNMRTASAKISEPPGCVQHRPAALTATRFKEQVMADANSNCTLPPIPSHVNDLRGRQFGTRIVIEYRPRGGRSYWLCRCSCGREDIVYGSRLLNGESSMCRSCREKGKRKTHGKTGTPEHRAWILMTYRCYNADCKCYGRYGGRGIIVCEHWRNSFENFLEDMGPRPSRQHSIDRFPNTKGNYEPGNCRWATRKQQQRNLKSNRLIEFRGETLCVSEWAERLGVDRHRIYDRLNRGWSDESAITEPFIKNRSHGKSS